MKRPTGRHTNFTLTYDVIPVDPNVINEEDNDEEPTDDGLINWFFAKFPGSRCKACNTEIAVGQEIGYLYNEIVGKECCAGSGVPSVSSQDVLPHGKTAKDACPNCFLVHATLQTECE